MAFSSIKSSQRGFMHMAVIDDWGKAFLKSIKTAVDMTKSPNQFGILTRIFFGSCILTPTNSLADLKIFCLIDPSKMGKNALMLQRKIILGIDPGTRITGYGLIDTETHPLNFGCIRPPPKLSLADRYKILFESIEALIKRYEPSAIAVESQFVLKNAQSAIKLGMAKGMVYLAAARCSIPIYEFAPKQAKLAVVGNGGASKSQVQKMIQVLLRLPQPPEPQDAADALSLAICCAHQMKGNIKNGSK